MIRFTMLGGIDLTGGDGAELDELLRQPKRLALLAYLTAPVPGTWHRRDSLLALFWPDLEAGRARTSLRNALYVLRQSLGEGVVRTRGDDEVSIDPQAVETDLAALVRAFEGGRVEEGITLYRGDLLPGFYAPASEGFERWLEEERSRLRAKVARAAAGLSDAREREGDVGAAIRAAEQAAELDPDDESAVRRLMRLFEAAGDRAKALAQFERFKRRLATEFGAEPAAETLALATRLRSQTAAPVGELAVPSPRGAPGAPELERAGAPELGTAGPAPGGREGSTAQAPGRRWRGWLVAALVGVTAVGALIALRTPAGAPGGPTRTLLVLPVLNRTGNAANDYLAVGFGEDLSKQLRRAPALRVIAAVRPPFRPDLSSDPTSAGRQFNATQVLQAALDTMGESLLVRLALTDVASGERRQVAERTLRAADLQAQESELTAAVLGALFRAPVPQFARASARRIDPESYRLTLQGFDALVKGWRTDAAKQLFLAAIEKDPGNARAWAGLSSAWTSAALSGAAPPADAFDRAEAAARRALAIDSTDGTAWANLGHIRIVRDNDLSGGGALFERAKAVDPGNPEIYLVQSVSLRQSGHFEEARAAIRVARQLDPFTMRYAEREGFLYLCEGRVREALAVYQQALAIDSANPALRSEYVRALARLGRFDDAISTWAAFATQTGDSALAALLAHARGPEGYWAARHEVNRPMLVQRLAEAKARWRSPASVAYAYIAAGLTDSGLAILERSASAADFPLRNLACNPLLDEVRDEARFAVILAKYGRTPAP